MSTSTLEGIVQNGAIRLRGNVRLPENTRVLVVIPGVESGPRASIRSPRLVHPEQASDFAKEVVEVSPYVVMSYWGGDVLPVEAENLFAEELEYSRKPLPKDRADRDCWRFACVCAVTPEGHVLGGVHLDIGPINFGPLAKERLAFVEGVFVRPEYRRRGVGVRIMQEAISVARNAGCLHMQCSVKWDNPAGIALYRKCGFALTDITDDEGGEYFAVKPLQVTSGRRQVAN